MKKIFLFIFSCIMLSHLNAMQGPIENRKLFVENKYGQSIKLVYTLGFEEKIESLLVEKNETKELPDWYKIKKLFIYNYGEWKSLVSKTTLGMKADDYFFMLHEAAARFAKEAPGKDLVLTIEAGVAKTGLTSYFGAIAPFKVEINSMEREKKEGPITSERLLQKALPRVDEALISQKEVLPRYVLGLGADATSNDIENAHRRLLETWEPIAGGHNVEDAAYAKDLLKAINLAYTVLKGEQEFKEFVTKNFYSFTRYPEKK